MNKTPQPKIFALHGNLGLPEDWLALQSRFPYSQWTCPNLWEFLKEDETLSLKEIGEIIRFEIEKMSYDLLIGYSLGGRILLQALSEMKEYKEEVLLISTNLAISESLADDRLQWDQNWAQKCLDLKWNNFLDEWDSLPVFESDPLRVYPEDLINYKKEISRAFEQWSLGYQDFDSYSLMQIPHSFLLLTGELDIKCTENNQYWGAYLENVKHQIVPQAGHRLIMNQVEWVEKAIQKKIASKFSF